MHNKFTYRFSCLDRDASMLLRGGLHKLDLRLEFEQFEELDFIIDRLKQYNSHTNLIAPCSDTELVLKHVLDSLAPWKLLRELKQNDFNNKKLQIADVGSGAGFPVLMLALVFKGIRFTMIESKSRKTKFHKEVLQSMEWRHVSSITEDVHKVNKPFDIITSRAFAKSKKILDSTKSISKKESIFFLYKGLYSSCEEELNEIEPNSIKSEIKKIEVPFLNSERHIILINKKT